MINLKKLHKNLITYSIFIDNATKKELCLTDVDANAPTTPGHVSITFMHKWEHTVRADATSKERSRQNEMK